MVLETTYRMTEFWLEIWADGKCVGALHKFKFPDLIKQMEEAIKDDG